MARTGARIPLAFNRILVWFTAGPTTCDVEVVVDNRAFVSVAPDPAEQDHSGEVTVGRVSFTAVRPELDGNEIAEVLGISPGPVLGRAYKHLLEVRLDRGPIGHEAAVEAPRAWWADQPESSP